MFEQEIEDLKDEIASVEILLHKTLGERDKFKEITGKLISCLDMAKDYVGADLFAEIEPVLESARAMLEPQQ